MVRPKRAIPVRETPKPPPKPRVEPKPLKALPVEDAAGFDPVEQVPEADPPRAIPRERPVESPPLRAQPVE